MQFFNILFAILLMGFFCGFSSKISPVIMDGLHPTAKSIPAGDEEVENDRLYQPSYNSLEEKGLKKQIAPVTSMSGSFRNTPDSNKPHLIGPSSTMGSNAFYSLKGFKASDHIVDSSSTVNCLLDCPPDTTVMADWGCGAIVYLPEVVITGNCAGPVLNDYNDTEDASDIYPVGVTEVTFSAVDSSGAIVSCQFTVTVEDNRTPNLTCPNGVRRFVENGEVEDYVELERLVYRHFCEIDTIENSYNDGGAEASDYYPVGITVVVFTAVDANGNSSTCNTRIEIRELPILDTLTFEISNISGLQGTTHCVPVFAHNFEEMLSMQGTIESSDTSVFKILGIENFMPIGQNFGINVLEGGSRVVFSWFHSLGISLSDSTMVFCIEIELVSEELDSANANWVEFPTWFEFVRELDGWFLVLNPELIPGTVSVEKPTYFDVSGSIETFYNVPLNDVLLSVSEKPDYSTLTDSNGLYGLALHDFATWMVSPEKDTNWMEGVSTHDLILIQQHLMGNNLFSNPYEFIAADVNNDGLVSTLDLLHLQRLIMGVQSDIPGNTSWRFVPHDYVFSNPADPFEENWPESRTYIDLDTSLTNENFIAIKVGDLSGDAGQSGERLARSDFNINLSFAEDEKSVVVKAGEDFLLYGYQMEWEFAPHSLQIAKVDIAHSVLPGINDNQFLIENGEGILRNNWWNDTPVSIEKDDELFRLILFEGSNRESAAIQLQRRGILLHSEAYGSKNNQIKTFDLVARPIDRPIENSGYKLHQNEPNPFRSITVIPFKLPEPSNVELEIINPTGELLFSTRINGIEGMNRFQLELPDIKSSVLFYRIHTDKWSAVKRMTTY